MSTIILTPPEMATHLAQQAQAKRLALNLSQKSLAERSGVSYGALKKFERTGQISLISLLKLALVLNSLGDFEKLFAANPLDQITSLDHLMIDTKTRKRGRK